MMDIKMYKNKHISAYAQSKIDKLNKQLLELVMENAELKDMVLDNGGEYADNIRILTDGYEAGSPSEYEEDKQLNIFESPDGGKTIFQRLANGYDTERVLIKSPDDNPNQLNLFND